MITFFQYKLDGATEEVEIFGFAAQAPKDAIAYSIDSTGTIKAHRVEPHQDDYGWCSAGMINIGTLMREGEHNNHDVQIVRRIE